MLYQSTRNPTDSYTAARALSEDRAPDGGFYIPMKLPQFDRQQIKALGRKSFSENAVQIINLFFSTQLDSWGLEFAIGRYPVRSVTVSSRETVAELWHNPLWKFERLARGVEKAVRQSDHICEMPSDWLMIASRIAVLFGIFGELIREGKVSPQIPIDIAVPNGNFSGPMAAWYAKQMGLPISNILCCCNDNNGTWKLLHKGEIRTDVTVIKTVTPACDDPAPTGLERLIYAKLGSKASVAFSEACKSGTGFYLEPEQQEKLRQDMYVPVTGQRRLESAVKSLYSTCGYLPDPYTALCYSGVLDYRSVTGESRPVLILSEEGPIHSLEFLSDMLNQTPQQLKNSMDR